MTSEGEGRVTMAERWGLIVEESSGPYGRHYEPKVVGEVTGTREEALARLEQVVAEYTGNNEYGTVRRRLFRTDDGFIHVHGNGMRASGIRFSVAELISDTDDAKTAAAAEKKAAKERKAAERRARREQRRMVVDDEFEDDVEDEG